MSLFRRTRTAEEQQVLTDIDTMDACISVTQSDIVRYQDRLADYMRRRATYARILEMLEGR